MKISNIITIFTVCLLCKLYQINAEKIGKIFDVNELETYEDAIDALETNEKNYKDYMDLKKNLKKFNVDDFKCNTSFKNKCVINEHVFEQINFINDTVVNKTSLENGNKRKFSIFVNNIKTINYIHYSYSNELQKYNDDIYFTEYYPFPVELYSYVAYFKYEQDEETIIKISNYLDVSRHHAKNIIDHIRSLEEKLSEYDNDIQRNYVRNYRNINKRKNILWWHDMYYYFFG
jgi:hypothetical protein